MPIAILLNGPPTAGKGVQGQNIEKYFNSKRIITSDVLREDGHTEKMKKGIMVDDHIVFQSVISRIEEGKNHIFDGFARTPEQATIFPQKLRDLGFDLIVTIELNMTDEEVALERRLNRKKEGGSNYRPDGDRKKTFLERFRRHNQQADEVRKILLRSCDNFFIINATIPVEEVSRHIRQNLSSIFYEGLCQIYQSEFL